MCKECIIQLGYDDVLAEDCETVLAVGYKNEWTEHCFEIPRKTVVCVAFEDLTEAVLEEWKPVMIVSPVLAQRFDCVELTLRLRSLGYRGEYRAVAQNMPKPTLIEREVKQLYPDLNFKVEIDC